METVTKKNLLKLTAIASLMSVAGGVHAATETDTMTNIATVADACDVVATGVDFGIVPRPILPTGIPGIVPNTTAGVTGHPDAGSDGGDTLSLLGIAVPFDALPGVYVACTVSPSSITLTSGNGGSLNLPVALGPAVGAFASKMTGAGGSLDYTMTFVGAAVTPPVGLPATAFVAAYAAASLIPAAQSSTFGAGFYTDVATVTVNY